MASTSEELSSQAEVLQSTIAFFKIAEVHGAASPQARRPVPARQPAVSRSSDARATAAGLSKLSRVVKSAGPSIELDRNNGGADAHDRDFTVYQD